MKRREISPAALPPIGSMFAGGFYAGRIFFDGAEYALIEAGREYECAAPWWDHSGPRPRIRGATNRFDGMANTLAMSAEGCSIATKVLAMNVRGTWGWHIPSVEELQVIRANLTQLQSWNHRLSADAPQAFEHHQYWSSTQKENAATAWLMGMYPWAVPDTNWVSKTAGIRPVKVMKIKAGAFIHAPHSDEPEIVGRNLSGLVACPAIEAVLERFVNEDAGRFYGRTDELVAELARIGAEQRT